MFKLIAAIFLLSYTFANEAESTTREMKIFNSQCISKTGEPIIDGYVFELYISCAELARDLLPVMDKEQERLDKVVKPDSDCIEKPDIDPVDNLRSLSSKMEEKIECTPKEVKEKEVGCAKKMGCNVLRSVNSLAESSIVPWYVEKTIKKSIKLSSIENSVPKGCLESKESNCFERFVSAFSASFMETLKGVWDLAKKGVVSLFNMGPWADKKAKQMHAAAVQTETDINDLKEQGVGKWLLNKFTGFGKSIEKWILSSALCQQWEGEPHHSKCIRPSTSFGCSDCGDRMNAVCSTIGAMASEGVLMVATAGVGYGASVATRIGSKALLKISSQVTSKLKIVAPALKAPPGKFAKLATKVASTAAKGSIIVGKATLAAVMKTKENALKFVVAMEKIPGVKTLEKAADILTDPLRMSTKASNLGVKIAESSIGLVGGKKTAQKVAVLNRVDSIARASSQKKDIHLLQERVTSKVGVGSRVHSSTSAHIGGTQTGSVSFSGGSHPHGAKPHETTGHASDHTTSTQHDSSSHNTNEHGQNSESQRNTDKQDKQSMSESRKEASGSKEKQKAKENKENKENRENKENKEERENKKNPKNNLLGAAALADMSSKIFSATSQGSSPVEQSVTKEAKDYVENKRPQSKVQNQTEFAKAINASSNQAMSREQAGQKLDEMQATYSDRNRKALVNKIRQSDQNISNKQANDFISAKQKQLSSARKYFETANQSKQLARTSFTKDLESKKSQLDDLVNSLKSGPSVEELVKKAENKAREKAPRKLNSKAQAGVVRSPTSRRSGNSGGTSASGPSSFSSSSFSSSSSQAPSAEEVYNESILRNLANQNKAADQKSNNDKAEKEPKEVSDAEYASSESLNLFHALNNENIEVVGEMKIDWGRDDIDSYSTLADEAEKSFLKKLREHNNKVKSMVVYKHDNFTLEVYEFGDGKKYSFLLDKESRRREIVPKKTSKKFMDAVISSGK